MGAALLLALLAPALGGGTSVMAVAVLLAGVGLVVVGLPARGVRVGFLIGAGLVLAVALGWAWPARFFALPWRGRLAGAGFPVEWCVSAAAVGERAGLAAAAGRAGLDGWCMGQAWTRRERREIAEGLAVGIGVIAAGGACRPAWDRAGVATGDGAGAIRESQPDSGAVRNGRVSDGGVWGGEVSRDSRGGAGWAVVLGLGWVCLLGVYTAALAVNRSRAGPVLFAAMTLAWLLAATPPRKRKPETIVAGAAVALLLATVFLLTGRAVMARLAGSGVMDFRLKIYSDALRMIRDSPWTGTGLGSFNAIFPLYRNASVLQERVLHPESDWLWLAAEAGLPGVVAVAGLLGWMGALVVEGAREGGGSGDAAGAVRGLRGYAGA